MQNATQQDADNAPKTRRWDETSQMDDEWTPDNVEDLSEGTIRTLAPREPYIKELRGENKDGSEWQTEKAYVYVDIDGRVLPTRVNKYSRKELSDAYGQNIRKWHEKKVVIVIDRNGKWPFCVLKPKQAKSAKGKNQ